MNSKIVVNEVKIEFFYVKHLFLKIDWSEINSIKIFKEHWKTPYYRGRIGLREHSGYSIQFIGLDLNKIVRLWCFPFKYNNQKLIISGLQEFSQKLNKIIVIDESYRNVITPNEPKCSEFFQFRKMHRLNKIKKNQP